MVSVQADFGNQYALHITRAAFALCAKTALTPQYALPHNALSKIIGRIHTLILYKCPKMLAMFDNPAAFAAQGAFTSACLFKKLFHTLHQWEHPFLKSPPLQCPVPNSLSHLQYFLRQTVKLQTYLANRASGLAYRLEIPLQMRPAYLSDTTEEAISAPAVTDQFATEGAQQIPCRFLASLGVNHKNGCTGATQGPQPSALSIASTPAGFIRMRHILTSDVLAGFIVWLFQCLGQLRLTITQPPKTHRHTEYLVYHRQRLTLARIEHTGQNRHQSQYARAKVSAFDFIRQKLVDKLSTCFATIYFLDVFDDFRSDRRYIDNLMTQRLLVGFFKVPAAARAYLRLQFKTLLYHIRRQQLSQIRLMPVLCPAFSTSSPWQHSGHSGWVSGRRFGRVLRVHPQESFKLFDAILQLFDAFFQFRVLLFQLLYICVLVHIILIGQR
jgi:hypothetical protein